MKLTSLYVTGLITINMAYVGTAAGVLAGGFSDHMASSPRLLEFFFFQLRASSPPWST